jgi:hypothetical protein
MNKCTCPLIDIPKITRYYIPFFNIEKRQMEMIVTNQAGFDKYKNFMKVKS